MLTPRSNVDLGPSKSPNILPNGLAAYAHFLLGSICSFFKLLVDSEHLLIGLPSAPKSDKSLVSRLNCSSIIDL